METTIIDAGLFVDCEAYLLELGFVREVRNCNPSLTDKDRKALEEFHIYSFSHDICGTYEVVLTECKGGAKAQEVDGSVIVSIEKISLEKDAEGKPLGFTEVKAITITEIDQLKLLVTGTRTWRFMHLS